MSYILDALRKEQKSLAQVHFIDAEADANSDANHERKHNVLTYLAILSVLSIAGLLGYVAGGGVTLIKQQYFTVHSLATPVTDSVANDQPLKTFYGVDATDLGQFFDNPKQFNEQVLATKKSQYLQTQQRLLAQQLADKQSADLVKQQALALQIEQLMKARGLASNSGVVIEQASVDTPDAMQLSLNEEGLSDVSPYLLEAFQAAIDETNNDLLNEQRNNPVKPEPEPEPEPDALKQTESVVKSIAQMPRWLQDSVPTLQFSLHMYTSVPADSWVRLNGKDYYTGAVTPDGVVIEKILPQQVYLQFEGQRFSMKALSTW